MPAPEHPDDKKLDQSHAAMTRRRRRGQRSSIVEMSLVAGAAVLISVSAVFSAWNTFEVRKHTSKLQQLAQEEVRTRQTILEGTKCLVEQLSEHRHLTALAHRADADKHGYAYPIPPEQEPPPVPGRLEQSCGIFITTTTGNTR